MPDSLLSLSRSFFLSFSLVRSRAHVDAKRKKKCEYECATSDGRVDVYKCRDEAGKRREESEREKKIYAKQKKKKDIKQTKNALCIRTPSSSSQVSLHVCCSRRTFFFLSYFFFFFFILSFLYTDVEFTHRIFLCLFSEHFKLHSIYISFQ